MPQHKTLSVDEIRAERDAKFSETMVRDKKIALACALNIPPVLTVARTSDGNEFKLRLETGAVIPLGPAKDVVSFGKIRAAIADGISHVIPGKEAKNWDYVSQLILDIELAERAKNYAEAKKIAEEKAAAAEKEAAEHGESSDATDWKPRRGRGRGSKDD